MHDQTFERIENEDMTQQNRGDHGQGIDTSDRRYT